MGIYNSLYKSNIITNYSLIQYDNNNFRFIISNICTKDGNKSSPKSSKSSYNTNYQRTKRIIRELALSNSFDFFVTLTVSPAFCNRSNLDEIIKYLRKYLKKYKRKNSNFIYLLIAEKHKDNKNYHFHGLMSGINKKDIYINKNNYYSCSFFDDIGFNSFSNIKDKKSVSNYITKYISKEICKISTGHSYFCSRGLNRPSKTYYKPINIDYLLPKTFENDYCKFYDFNLSDLDKKTTLSLFYLFDKNKLL